MFFVKGNAIFNKQVNLLNITEIGIESGNTNMKVKSFSISMYAKCKNEKRLIFSSGSGNKESAKAEINLSEELRKKTSTIREHYGYEEYFTDEIIKKFDEIVYLEIEYVDSKNQSYNYNIDINATSKTLNNKFIYSKGPHI